MKWILLISMLIAGQSLADMRCDGRLVDRGATPYEVYERCGPAVWQTQRVEFLAEDVPVYIDEWLYEQGSNRFRRLLRFENGRLERVELLRKPDRVRI